MKRGSLIKVHTSEKHREIDGILNIFINFAIRIRLL